MYFLEKKYFNRRKVHKEDKNIWYLSYIWHVPDNIMIKYIMMFKIKILL